MNRLIVALTILATAVTCGASVNTSNIKHNPHPKMRYELTLTIHDAPGPFESVEGAMQYEVTDKRCSPENPISGTWRPPHVNIPFTFTRVADNVYTGTVYLDMLKDEDYYGLGVCHWQMNFAIVGMKASGAEFSPDISSANIVTGNSETAYFPKKAYADTSFRGMSDGGMPMSNTVARYRNEFFSTTLSAREQFE